MKTDLRRLFAVAALLNAPVFASAATYTWSAGTPDAAAGNWNDGSFNGLAYVAGDTLVIDGVAKTITVANPVAAPAELDVTTSNAVTLTGGSVGGLLAMSGTGKLTLSSTNAFSGINFSGGNITAATAASLGSGTIGWSSVGTVEGTSATAGVLTLSSTAATTLANNITLGGSGGSTKYFTLIKGSSSATGGTTLTLSGVISGGDANTVLLLTSDKGSDTTTTYNVTGTNTLAGTVEVWRGVLLVGSAGALGSATVYLNSNGSAAGDLQFASSMSFANNITVASGGSGNIGVSGTASVTLSGVIASGSKAINKVGTGTMVLSGANTYATGTNINGGYLGFANAGAVPASGTITVNANGSLIGSGAYATMQDWLASGKIAAGSTGSIAITGNSSENVDFSANGYNSLGLSSTGTATYSGVITPGSNGYIFGGDANTLLTVSSQLSGSSALAKNGPGILILSNASNNFSGDITINNGPTGTGTFNSANAAVTATAATALGSGTIRFGSTSNLRGLSLNFTGTVNNNLVLNSAAAGTLTLTSGSAGHTVNLAGQISGGNAGTTLQIDAGSSNPSGSWVRLANTGNTFVVSKIEMNRGGLAITGDGSLGAAGNVLNLDQGGSNSGGVRFDAANINLAHAVSVTSSSWFEMYGDNTGTNTTFTTNNATISGNITGTAALGVYNQRGNSGAASGSGGNGVGALTLTGSNGGYSGAWTVTNATRLIAGSANALGTGSVSVASGGALQIGLTGGALAVSNVGNITLTSGTLDLSAATGGAVTLTLASTKILTLDAASSLLIGMGDRIVLSGGGASTLAGTLNLAGEFDGVTGTQNYTLISASGGSTITGGFSTISGYDTNKVSAAFDATSGIFTITAVPEPSVYGLLGAGVLAGMAVVRRRKR